MTERRERVHLQIHTPVPDAVEQEFQPPPVLSQGGLHMADQGEWDDALYADDAGMDRRPDEEEDDEEDDHPLAPNLGILDDDVGDEDDD